MAYELIYIHPAGLDWHSRTPIIPMGVWGLMRSVACSKIGVFSDELDEDLVKNAKIAALDLHWYYHLNPVMVIAKKLKTMNPSIHIIVGGYTATVLAESLIENSPVDLFIIKGDAEHSFPLLVGKLLNNETVLDVPNVVSKNYCSSRYFSLGPDTFGQCTYSDLNWFPALQRIIYKAQRIGYPSLLGPWIPVNRGCKYYCNFCYGNPILQEKICRRRGVSRSALSVRDDLIAWSRDKKVEFVHFISDFLDYHGIDYTKTVLGLSYNLSVYYEFYNIPKIDEIRLFLDSFKYCYFWFTPEKDHTGNRHLNDFNTMDLLFRYLQGKNCCIGLFVSISQISKNKTYFKMLWNLWSRYKIYFIEYNWDIEVPNPLKDQKHEFEKFFNLSKKNDSILGYFKNRIVEKAYSSKLLFASLLFLETYRTLVKCVMIYARVIAAEKITAFCRRPVKSGL